MAFSGVEAIKSAEVDTRSRRNMLSLSKVSCSIVAFSGSVSEVAGIAV